MLLEMIVYLLASYVWSVFGTYDLDIHIDRLKKLDGFLTDTRKEAIEEFGRNKTRNLMIWDTYYVCLEKQLEAIGSKRVLAPESLSILEGENVHMECRVCLYPGDQLSTANWYWYNIRMPMDEWTVLDRKGKLSIYGVRQEEAGLYECRIGSTRSRPYFLHVVPDSELLREVKPRKAKVGPYSAPPIMLQEESLKVFTHWNPWTECTRCDKVGRRYKFGTCTVSFTPHKNEGNSTKNVKTWEILQLFVQGLPCLSPLLPKEARENLIKLNRSNEMMVGFCKEPCADEIFEVKNMFGKILEKVNNSAGLFSVLQGPPPLPPMPGRLTVYAQMGLPLTVSCPGHGLSDLPYRWAIGKKARLAPWLARTQSLGRVTINAKQQLSFSKVQPDDERLYSCWQGQTLTGVVRLLVVEDRRFKVNHHIILFGTILILSTFCYVFIRIFMNRKRAASVYY